MFTLTVYQHYVMLRRQQAAKPIRGDDATDSST
jgi:hypothetical protein